MKKIGKLSVAFLAVSALFLCQCSKNSNPAGIAPTAAQQIARQYSSDVYLAGVLVNDPHYGKFIVEVGTAFKMSGNRYYSNAHVALVLNKIAGAYIPSNATRPVGAVSIALVPSGQSTDDALTLTGFTLHPDYDTTLETPDLSQLFLANLPQDPSGIPSPSLAQDSSLAAGQEVVTMGFPGETSDMNLYSPQATLKQGVISTVLPLIYLGDSSLIEYDLDLTPGTSGSPVFNTSGNLVAVNYSGVGSGSICFGIRSDLLGQLNGSSPRQLFAAPDTSSRDYLIMPGTSVGDLALGIPMTTWLRLATYGTLKGTVAYFTDSLTYTLQAVLDSNDRIRAMRLYSYFYTVLGPSFYTSDNIFIGDPIEEISAVYSPSLISVQQAIRGHIDTAVNKNTKDTTFDTVNIDTVNISVVQSKGIAFVSDPYAFTISEIYVFSPSDTFANLWKSFRYVPYATQNTQTLAKRRAAAGNGAIHIKAPGCFFRLRR